MKIPTYWKLIIFIVIITYMMVNESERIENEERASNYRFNNDRKLEEIIESLVAPDNFTYNHGHIYHDDKPFLPRKDYGSIHAKKK